MAEIQETVGLEARDLVGAVAGLVATGHRLVQICCTAVAGGCEITYSFDKDGRLRNLRVAVKPGEQVPSVSGVCWSAFLYENEIHDLFGVEVTNIAIDYRGTLYRTRVPAPFAPVPAPAGGVAGEPPPAPGGPGEPAEG